MLIMAPPKRALFKQYRPIQSSMINYQRFNFSSQPESVTEMAELTDWDAYLESDIPVVLQAGASWCGPCKTLKPMLTEVASKFEGKVKYVYCDVDKFP
jgi:thiol-disulfide isomerase/thioredoxin